MPRLPLRYYLPRALAERRRALLPWIDPGRPLVECLPGRGPEPVGGGLCIGGAWRPDEPGWLTAAEGWLLHPGEATPDDLARLSFVPGSLVAVPGALPGQVWRVPVLALRVSGCWQSALSPVLGPAGWECPRPYAAITHRLLAALESSPEATAEDLAGYAELCADILNLNYEVALPPLRLLGWLSLDMLPRILAAAAGRPPEDL
jgi:hypothetical protein